MHISFNLLSIRAWWRSQLWRRVRNACFLILMPFWLKSNKQTGAVLDHSECRSFFLYFAWLPSRFQIMLLLTHRKKSPNAQICKRTTLTHVPLGALLGERWVDSSLSLQGSYKCGPCNPGYIGDGYAGCQAGDLCTNGSHTCHVMASCRSQGPGIYSCKVDVIQVALFWIDPLIWLIYVLWKLFGCWLNYNRH